MWFSMPHWSEEASVASPWASSSPHCLKQQIADFAPLEWSICLLETDLSLCLTSVTTGFLFRHFPTPLFGLYSIWWFTHILGFGVTDVSHFVKDIQFLFLVLLVAFVWFSREVVKSSLFCHFKTKYSLLTCHFSIMKNSFFMALIFCHLMKTSSLSWVGNLLLLCYLKVTWSCWGCGFRVYCEGCV